MKIQRYRTLVSQTGDCESGDWFFVPVEFSSPNKPGLCSSICRSRSKSVKLCDGREAMNSWRVALAVMVEFKVRSQFKIIIELEL